MSKTVYTTYIESIQFDHQINLTLKVMNALETKPVIFNPTGSILTVDWVPV